MKAPAARGARCADGRAPGGKSNQAARGTAAPGVEIQQKDAVVGAGSANWSSKEQACRLGLFRPRGAHDSASSSIKCLTEGPQMKITGDGRLADARPRMMSVGNTRPTPDVAWPSTRQPTISLTEARPATPIYGFWLSNADTGSSFRAAVRK